jgi:CRP-like cAMP-binding protein
VSAATNNLLRGLDASARTALLAGSRPVALHSGDLLADSGRRIARVIFPIDCSISLMLPVPGAAQVEAGLVGREGMVGIPLALGTPVSAMRAVVQGSGDAWCVDAARFVAQLKRSLALRQRLNRYIYVRLIQSAHGAACRSSHHVEERLTSWLLMSRDRALTDELVLTHELLARTLGVRRAGVTVAASALQERGLIRYVRGHIVLLDGRGLEAAACACYQNEKKIYASYLD